MKVNKRLADIYRKDVIQDSKLMREYIAWFDSLRVNPLLSYFSIEDINLIHKIATSPAMHCNMNEKYGILGEIMEKRGFKLIGGGTNRRAYECIYDNMVVAKVATDPVGFTSNLRECINQNVLKPFCNKNFEVTPCGSLAIIEKLVPIKEVPEFQKYAQEIYDILYFKIRNNSIAMDDIGTRSMKNWGYRPRFGPALLDYPTMYVADPKKRLCKNIVNGKVCCGTLDYDEGFNRIVCSECGGTYFAKTIAKDEGDDIRSLLSAVGYLKKEGVRKMKFEIVNESDGKVVSTVDCGGKCNHVDPTMSNHIIGGGFPNNMVSSTSKKKRPKVTVVDIDSEEETKAEPVVGETVISNTTVTPNPDSTPSKQEQFMTKFNLLNSGVNFDVVDGDYISVTDLAKVVNEVITVGPNPYVSEEKASNIYKCLCAATAKSNNFRIHLYDYVDKVCATNTLLNDMLMKISNSTDPSNNFNVFFKLINNVKNTRAFFKSILSFWETFIDMCTFDTNAENGTHRVFTDALNMYRETVYKALEDYRFNIICTSGMTYNLSNVLSIINVGVSQLEYAIDMDDTFTYDINVYKSVTITIFNQFVEFSEDCEDSSEDKSFKNFVDSVNEACLSGVKDPEDISQYNGIVTEESEEDSEPSPAELYDAMVQGNEKTGTKNQQQRYGGNNNKKNKKRRHH